MSNTVVFVVTYLDEFAPRVFGQWGTISEAKQAAKSLFPELNFPEKVIFFKRYRGSILVEQSPNVYQSITLQFVKLESIEP